MGIRERAEIFGGSAQIESAPGQGTRVEVRLPLPGAGGP
jgi:signal transduction histidine kinase